MGDWIINHRLWPLFMPMAPFYLRRSLNEPFNPAVLHSFATINVFNRRWPLACLGIPQDPTRIIQPSKKGLRSLEHIRLERKSCRISYSKLMVKYDRTYVPT